jgi:hypothetical protein
MKRLLKQANEDTIINRLKSLSPEEKDAITKEVLKNADGWINKDSFEGGVPSADTETEYFLTDYYDLDETKNLLKLVFAGQGLDKDIDEITDEDDIWNAISDDIASNPLEKYFEEEIEDFKENGFQEDPNKEIERDYWKSQGV